MKTTVLYLFLFLSYYSYSQVVTVNSGNWNTGSTWSTGIVPGASDDVIIRHTITISNSPFTATVRSLTLDNGALNTTATLSFNSGTAVRSLHVLNDLIVSATSNNNCRLMLQGENTSSAVDGDIILNRNHSGIVSAFGITLRQGSSMTANDMSIYYANSTDDNQEVFIRENSSMILSGDVLIRNTGGVEEPSLDVVDDAYFECRNLTTELTLPEAPAGIARDAEVRVWNNGRMVIHGDFNLLRTGGRRINITIGNSSPATASILVEGNMLVEHLNGLNETNKDLPITVVDQCSLTVRGNLTAYSNSARALNFNFFGTSQFDVDGIITLTGSSSNNLTINANNNSRFFFGNDIVMSFPTLPNAALFFFASSSPNISTVTFDGSANQTIPGLETYGNLIINNPSYVTLAGNITVTTSLAMNSGKVKAANRVVTLPLGASITGSSSSYICNGKLSRGLTAGSGPYWFYLGDTIRGYSPVTLANLSATSTFEVKYFPENAGAAPAPGPYPIGTKETILDRVTPHEYWTIDRVSGAGSARVTLGWNAFSAISHINLDKLRVTRWNGAQWTDLGATTYTGDVNAGLVTTTGNVNNFSPFTLASTVINNFIPLAALSLNDFTAQVKGNRVLLNWQSTAIAGKAKFVLERSADGSWFETLEEVAARSSTGEMITYSFIDEHPFSCKTSYRLRQINADNNVTVSRTITVNTGSQFSLFPNPALLKSSTVVQVIMPECNERSYCLQIIDVNGKEKYRANITAGAKGIQLPVDRLGLTAGVYLVSLKYGSTITSTGMIVQ